MDEAQGTFKGIICHRTAMNGDMRGGVDSGVRDCWISRGSAQTIKHS